MKSKLTDCRSRRVAVKEGKRFYDPGRACRNGHWSVRYTKGGSCVECTKARSNGFASITAKEEGRSAQTSVYVIETAGRVKIGIAENIDARLQVFRTHSPFPVELVFVTEPMPRTAARNVEKTAHGQFKDRNVHGEWFDIAAAEAVRAIKEAVLFG